MEDKSRFACEWRSGIIIRGHGYRRSKWETQAHLIMEASIQGVNDSYLVILIIGILFFLLAFFIKRVDQAPEIKSSNIHLDKAVIVKA
ncbi:hypothetical protein [Fictibacillus terranigra]|uniref:Uncharacterized protein n=1 Tax=Fictibacillus terranigra TaxID=3058424 RepID=A0ABT8E2B3_9BACL|nr:hypothetical protein [Fictibacillus sp. CENA-BCM004]MDN4072049.1 hypothetical protein [Fictibacillus sp. CENA-BCM004]